MRAFLLLFLVTLAPMGAALNPCERVRAFLKAWERANERFGLRRKQMAGYEGISEQQHSMQMALVNNHHPSAARWALAPDDVYLNFAEELCDRVGTARVVRDSKLDRLIHVVEMLEAPDQRAMVPEKEKRRA